MRQGCLIHAVGRVRLKKGKEKKRNPAAFHRHHGRRKHSSAATSANSKRPGLKQIRCFSPSTPASVDAGFVETGHVQLSQSVRQKYDYCRQAVYAADKQRGILENNLNGSPYASRNEEAFSPVGKKMASCV